MADGGTPAFDEHVRGARIEALSRQRPGTWLGNLALMAIAVYALWPHHPGSVLLAWLLANALLAASRLRDWSRLRREGPPAPADAPAWLRRFSAASLLAAAIWAAGAWWFLAPLPFATLALVLLVYAGVVNGAMVALAPHLPAMALFCIPITLTVAARLLTVDDPRAPLLALITLAYAVFLLVAGRTLARSVDDVLRLDFEKQNLVAEAREAQARAEAANTEKSHFLASVSHDLRQPLYAMRLFLDSLAGRLTDHAARAIHADLARSHRALEDLLTGLLDLSRLDAGQVEVTPTHLDLDELLDEVIAEFSPQAGARGLSLQCASQGLVVRTDPVLFARVLRNLVDNAVKFTTTGGVRITAESAPGDSVRLRVSDTGPGIPPEEVANAFSAFHQLAGPGRDRERGVGLGLAVVQRLCALLQIGIDLDSRPGEGTTLTLSLAAGDRDLVPGPGEPQPREGLDGLHVIVIEDEAPIRRGLHTLLTDHGCRVTAADSAQAALVSVAHAPRPPDLVLSDYRLRGRETGLDAVQRLRAALDPQLPALLITGDTDPAVRTQAARAGLTVLSKPVLPSRLFKAITRLV